MNRAWIELNQQALEYNIKTIQKYLDPNCEIMGVVKANAYGHGACIVANQLEKIGIHNFAVATEDEAVELRRSGVRGQILILGYTAPEKVMELLQYDLTQTIVNAEYAKQLNRCCESVFAACMPEKANQKLKVHVALDTGMHRVGLPYNDYSAIGAVYELPYLNITGIYSHLCVADSEEEEQMQFTKAQISAYFDTILKLREAGLPTPGMHLQNSYACVNYTPMPCDYARLGLLMFGVKSDVGDYLALKEPLKPVMSLRAHITSVREIDVGETVGYGRTFRAQRPTTIASVSIGYADGIPRSLSDGKLRALVHGKSVPIAGRVCMDQLMLDVTGIDGVSVGDIATFIGTDGECSIAAEELAEKSGTITNEILSKLGRRLENLGFQPSGNV